MLLCDHFGAHELAEHDLRIGFFETRAFIIAHAFFHVERRGRAHRHTRHALDAAGKNHVLGAAHYRLGGKLHGLLR